MKVFAEYFLWAQKHTKQFIYIMNYYYHYYYYYYYYHYFAVNTILKIRNYLREQAQGTQLVRAELSVDTGLFNPRIVFFPIMQNSFFRPVYSSSTPDVG